jgi:hypothetical protein
MSRLRDAKHYARQWVLDQDLGDVVLVVICGACLVFIVIAGACR